MGKKAANEEFKGCEFGRREAGCTFAHGQSQLMKSVEDDNAAPRIENKSAENNKQEIKDITYYLLMKYNKDSNRSNRRLRVFCDLVPGEEDVVQLCEGEDDQPFPNVELDMIDHEEQQVTPDNKCAARAEVDNSARFQIKGKEAQGIELSTPTMTGSNRLESDTIDQGKQKSLQLPCSLTPSTPSDSDDDTDAAKLSSSSSTNTRSAAVTVLGACAFSCVMHGACCLVDFANS